MIILILRQPGEPDQRIELLGDSVLLGRNENSDVVLEEGFISNHHLRLMYGLVAIDQKSRNGTYLEGQRLDRPALIQDGDVLTLGKQNLTLEVAHVADGVPAEATLAQGVAVPDNARIAELEGELRAQSKVLELREREIERLSLELQQARKGA